MQIHFPHMKFHEVRKTVATVDLEQRGGVSAQPHLKIALTERRIAFPIINCWVLKKLNPLSFLKKTFKKSL